VGGGTRYQERRGEGGGKGEREKGGRDGLRLLSSEKVKGYGRESAFSIPLGGDVSGWGTMRGEGRGRGIGPRFYQYLVEKKKNKCSSTTNYLQRTTGKMC